MSNSPYISTERLRSLTGLPVDKFRLEYTLGVPRLHAIGCGQLSYKAMPLDLDVAGPDALLCTCVTLTPGSQGSLWGVIIDAAAVVDYAAEAVHQVQAELPQWFRANSTSFDQLRSTSTILVAAQHMRATRPHPGRRAAVWNIRDLTERLASHPGVTPAEQAAARTVTDRFATLASHFDACVARWPAHELWSQIIPTYTPAPAWTLLVLQRLDWSHLVRRQFEDDNPTCLRRIALATAQTIATVPTGDDITHEFVALRMPRDAYLEFDSQVLWNVPMDDDVTPAEVEMAIRHTQHSGGFNAPTPDQAHQALAAARAALAAPTPV